MLKNTFIAAFIFLKPCIALSWSLFTNYDDCVLENMKGVKSDIAARAIRNACLSKSKSWSVLENYDSCVLENIKEVESDVAARGILRSCRNKYPLEAIQQPSSAQFNALDQYSPQPSQPSQPRSYQSDSMNSCLIYQDEYQYRKCLDTVTGQ
jgi:hypothetical protein